MGYAENKKLAKDINNNTGDCSKLLKDTLGLLATKIELMNELVLAISQKYPAKSYIDAGDDAQQKKLEELLTQTENQRYVGSDHTEKDIQPKSGYLYTGLGNNRSADTNIFYAEHDGIVRLSMTFTIDWGYATHFNGLLTVNVHESDQVKYSVSVGGAGQTTNRAVLNISVSKGEQYKFNILNSAGSSTTVTFSDISIGYDIVTG